MRLFLLALLLPGIAVAQPQLGPGAPPPSKSRVVCITGASVGNGADVTEDTIQTCVVPANTLAKNGDTLKISTGGTFGATTDNKFARVRFGVGVAGAVQSALATVTNWNLTVVVTRTAVGTQSSWSIGGANLAPNGTGTLANSFGADETAPISITVTGQNVTSSVAGSLTSRGLLVEFLSGP
jgi:hypothetical protein